MRHIQRTKTLLHCVSAESKNVRRDYEIVRRELEKYNSELTKKKEMILLTKSDLIPKAEVKKAILDLKKINPKIIPVSIHDWESLEALKNSLFRLI